MIAKEEERRGVLSDLINFFPLLLMCLVPPQASFCAVRETNWRRSEREEWSIWEDDAVDSPSSSLPLPPHLRIDFPSSSSSRGLGTWRSQVRPKKTLRRRRQQRKRGVERGKEEGLVGDDEERGDRGRGDRDQADLKGFSGRGENGEECLAAAIEEGEARIKDASEGMDGWIGAAGTKNTVPRFRYSVGQLFFWNTIASFCREKEGKRAETLETKE